MAASVMSSPRAIEVSVFIVRAFVKLRSTIAQHKELAATIAQLEQRLAEHDDLLINPELPSEKQRIGFQSNEA